VRPRRPARDGADVCLPPRLDHKLPPGVFQSASYQAAITLATLGHGEQAADRLATDQQLFADYFQSLYQVINTDYIRRGESTIQEDRRQLRFREVARKAKVTDDDGQPVIVRFKARESIVKDIRSRVPGPA
jgi:hypothetical protein